ncbi:hypothetical protein QX233_23005, partial [Chryseobacterium gambrini]
FVEAVQKALIETFDDHREPAAVCDVLAVELARLERGEVPTSELQINNRVSKRVKEYTQSTRNVAALERAADLGMDKHPGEN